MRGFAIATSTMLLAIVLIVSGSIPAYGSRAGGIADSFYDVDELRKVDLLVYMEALDRALSYVNVSQTEDIHILLGLFMTEVHLTQATISKEFPKLKGETQMAVRYMITFCRRTRLTAYSHKTDVGEIKILQFMQDPNIWLKTGKSFKRGRLVRWLPRADNFSNAGFALEQFRELDMPWHIYHRVSTSSILTPSGGQSNNCLMSLSEFVSQSAMQPCNAGSFCRRIMMEGLSMGYSLTHRFLYLLFSSTVKHCYHTSPLGDQIRMDVLCAMLYLEACYIERFGYRKRDLFMEIVMLCSIRGYQEFVKKRWLSAILDWQSQAGCFVDSAMNYCELHPSGLGMVNVALAVRYTIQIKTQTQAKKIIASYN